ncbi:MAG: hybrid sensor histidine kinase/response regulator [Deltaproteobacteria bacterium]|nr:hybrid sensor histidine kinase/response regulator [Deltaproteobacteria bacterium]
MDPDFEGGGEQGELVEVQNLEEQLRLARGTIEQLPIRLHDPWPVGSAAWEGELDLEATSGAVFVVDDRGAILVTNRVARLLIDRDDDIVGTPIASVLVADAEPVVAGATPRGVRFVPASAGVMAHRRDGSRIAVELELIALDERTTMIVARTATATTIADIDIAEIVHDLKTPLSVISLEAQLAAERWESADAPTLQLDRIERNVAYMDHLVQELLDLCTADAGRLVIDPRPVEMRHLLEDVIERIVPSCERHRVQLEAPRLVLECDGPRLERVVANLIDNAIKHTSPAAGIVVRLTRGPNGVCISVIDAGPGIARDELARLFDKYRRGSTAARGSGLGLYVSRKIVEAHGGKLGVESVRGVGSRFFIDLPSRKRRAPVVLIVDDDTQHASPLAEILRMEGFEAITATTPRDALVLAEEYRPDIIVLDAMLRRSHAIDVLEPLRTRHLAAPTALVSGLPESDPRISKAVREYGCTYVAKPLELRSFLRLLDSFTGEDSPTGKFSTR